MCHNTLGVPRRCVLNPSAEKLILLPSIPWDRIANLTVNNPTHAPLDHIGDVISIKKLKRNSFMQMRSF
jgi:hypothetical protein